MRRHFIATRVFVVIATVLSTASSSSSSTSSSLYSSSAPSRQASPSSPLLAQSPATWSSSSTVGLLTCLRGGSVKASPNVMSLFSREEKQYERYAAALAAIEPLRKQRDLQAKATLRPFEYWHLKRKGKLSGGKGICDVARVDPKRRNARLRVVCNGHVKTMTSVIKALGLSVAEFNELTREVSRNADLAARVKQQTYFYRVAAELSRSAEGAEEIPAVDFVPQQADGATASLAQQQQQDLTRSAAAAAAAAAQKKKRQQKPKPLPVKTFAKVTHRVEQLRKKQESVLKKELKIEDLSLPVGICGSAYTPLLNPRVRSLCQSFPEEAQKVVEGYGVDVGSFNTRLAEADRNPVLRWRVSRVLRRAQAKAIASAKKKAKARAEAEKMLRARQRQQQQQETNAAGSA